MSHFVTATLEDKTVLCINPANICRIFESPDGKQVGIFFVDGTSYNLLGAGPVTKLLKDLEIKK